MVKRLLATLCLVIGLSWLAFGQGVPPGGGGTYCPTASSISNTTVCASTAFVQSLLSTFFGGVPITVPNGGTGDSTFTANLPLIGNGTSAIAQGTRAGNTTAFVTLDGSTTTNHCAKFDSSGGVVDAGASCFTAANTPFILLSSYSPVADAVAYASSSVSISSGNNTLTVTGASFTAGAVGKSIIVPGAGTAGAPLVTTISGYTSATQVSLTANAATNVSAAAETIIYGTDNTTAVQNWITACQAVNGICIINAGAVGFVSQVSITSPVTILGTGPSQYSNLLYYMGNGVALNVNTNSGVKFDGISLSSVPYTSGVASTGIQFTAPSGANYGSTVTNSSFSGTQTAIHALNASAMSFSGDNINNVNSGIFLEDQAAPYAGGFLIANTNIGCNVATPSSSYGAVVVRSGGNVQISSSMLHFCQYSIVVDPVNWGGAPANFQIGDFYISNTSMEQDSAACVALYPVQSGTANINSVTFTGGDCGGGAPNGFFIGNGNSDIVYDVTITGMNIYPDSAVSSPAYGVLAHSAVSGINVVGDTFAGGGGSNNTGISVVSGATGNSANNRYRGLNTNVVVAGHNWLDDFVGSPVPTTSGACPVNGFVGSSLGGIFVANGACVTSTVSLTFPTNAPNYWSCSAFDLTTTSDVLKPTGASQNGFSWNATMANSDNISFSCRPN